jgi:hypothetical protein
MKGTNEDLERQIAELRAQVVELKRSVVKGFIALGVVLILSFVPGIGLLGTILVGAPIVVFVFVLVFGTIGAKLGTWTGRAIRAGQRPPTPSPPSP